MDIFSKQKRSEIMSKISGKNTKPEILVRKYLFSHGFRYRINDKKLLGKPDIVLKKYSTVIFIHGCFWHGHDNCKKGARPTTNVEFWESKIQTNINRDSVVKEKLSMLGWNVITIWQCEIGSKKNLDERMGKIITELENLNAGTVVKQ